MLLSPKNILEKISSSLPFPLYFSGPGEQDLVLMCIKVSAKLPSGQLRSYEVFMAEKGTPVGGQSAMSRTVGITAAACAQVLATGEFGVKGLFVKLLIKSIVMMMMMMMMI